VYQRHRRDYIAAVVSMASKVGGIDTDRYRHITHVEQHGKCEEELAEHRPFPLAPEK